MDIELYKPEPKPPVVATPVRGLSVRVPREILYADSLVIKRSDLECHDHWQVVINGLAMCPVSAILMIVAAKNFRLSDGVDMAVKKIIRECYES